MESALAFCIVQLLLVVLILCDLYCWRGRSENRVFGIAILPVSLGLAIWGFMIHARIIAGICTVIFLAGLIGELYRAMDGGWD